ncbi:O-linked N-acetylglucosamine transferase family protein [Paraburkholderia silvatlantica]|uniref:protein O-GlcNAc transferase n=1 Tax=Paraburkholderia silvatlantica TaxID=321895 RepID=A0ABR6FWX7_9BURK|nr:tetratricopeptide repeat protein [Paraburkholderia silvatlantica]MBB2931930.1 putative O-linked N-acetylglucosamine transferase (SPINDLY family) [Paraburkholderia silvatlantica]PVY24803.1 putative O-linked N-acetylglucosamine transferase (SPINDLY family) [Paraburkholderia silvatlantica]PXW31915.1 putative O-linked N-acetylglucosamine transferase (SPINDLY family) [Paraburkholderia silvatlantica]
MTAFPTPTETTALAPQSQMGDDIRLVMEAGIEHHRKQEYGEAEALYAIALEADSDHVDANYHIGVLYMQTNRPAEAVPHFEAVLGHTPNFAQLWVYYFNALTASNQFEAARMALDVARQCGVPGDAIETLTACLPQQDGRTASEPLHSASHAAVTSDISPILEASDTPRTAKLDLRRASSKELRQYTDLFNSGKIEAALQVARRLTTHNPSHGECWIALAHALQRTGNYAESLNAAERAASLLPNNLLAQTMLADALHITRQFQQAETHCRKALERHPESAALHRTLGAALQALGRAAEGIARIQRAVELAPGDPLELDALGNALSEHGQYDEAESAFRRALELAPMQAATHSNLLFCLMHKTDLDAATAFSEFREYGVRHEAALRANWPQHTNERDPSRRLRIGFVSGDLINHPVAYFLLSVVEHLARDTSLSLHFYSNYAVRDGFTAQIRAQAHGWHEIFGMSDAMVAQKILNDGIDILIDLSGHTGRNRLVAFAHKPAPVQVSWIGNPATTGLTSIDYYMSDRFVTPLEQFASRFSEKLVFLPALAPFKPYAQAPEVSELPALKNGYLTFGSFSRLVKIGPEVVALWARVLREIPTSRMLIGAITSIEQMNKLAKLFAGEGIDVSRISFMQRKGTDEYLRQHQQVDVCLDAFPFAGSTTTMHALWMGVPTVTLPGVSMASRGSTGWLSHLGLEEAFVAHDKDDFVRKCVALAADLDALATVRRELRQHCVQSPIISASTIANAASRALRTMWQRWCDGLEAEHFEVLAQSSDTSVPKDSQPSQLSREQRAELLGEFIDTLTILLDKQQFDEATAVARQLTVLMPEVGMGWRMLATSLRQQGKLSEALEPLRHAAALLPSDQNIHRELAVLSQYANDRARIAPVNEPRPAAEFLAVREGSRQYRHPVGALVANIPVLIPAFNNTTYLRRMVSQLQSKGLRNLIVVDNASSAPAMLSYLESIQDTVSVVRLDDNVGPRAITLSDVIYDRLPDLFCITDPDLELNPELPGTFLFDLIDATEALRIGKAGFALDISQPELMNEKALGILQTDGANTYSLLQWEARFWQHKVGSTAAGDPIYQAPIDTTFALYNKRYFLRESHLAAVRFGGRYTCKHVPWYKDNGLDAAEDKYYREHQEWSTFLK